MRSNTGRSVVPATVFASLLTAVLYVFAQVLHQTWAERIVAPFAMASFVVNIHQGSLAVMIILMFAVFFFVTWIIIEGLRLERRRQPGE